MELFRFYRLSSRHMAGQTATPGEIPADLLFFAMGMWAKNVVYEAIDTANKEIARIHSIELGVDKR